uniref:Pentapeptide repeat-containing protein n=1 Tax=Desertifilum tharense IPPAS B-1220 TaxID=1781255 RepID=A0ACD5GQH3_9CYAN
MRCRSEGVDLTDADLKSAFLLRAKLTDSKLEGTNLKWASLMQVTPSNIDLSKAIIGGTIMPLGYSSGY